MFYLRNDLESKEKSQSNPQQQQTMSDIGHNVISTIVGIQIGAESVGLDNSCGRSGRYHFAPGEVSVGCGASPRPAHGLVDSSENNGYNKERYHKEGADNPYNHVSSWEGEESQG